MNSEAARESTSAARMWHIEWKKARDRALIAEGLLAELLLLKNLKEEHPHDYAANATISQQKEKAWKAVRDLLALR